MAASATIEVNQLVKAFRPHRRLWQSMRHPRSEPTHLVLAGIDLAVEQGEVVAITGENGAGKSTLLKIVATIISPTSGSVAVQGFDTVRDGAKVRSVSSYSFGDDRSFYWRLTGRQNLAFFAALNDLHGKAACKRIAEVTDSLRITERLDEPFRFYSAGIRQRFALARALLAQPRVLLLDEPTRSIDRSETAQVWNLIRKMSEDGVTVLLVTHSLAEAAALSDRVLLLRDGHLHPSVLSDELNPMERELIFTLRVARFRPELASRLRLISGIRHVSCDDTGPEQFLDVHSNNGDQVLPGLLAALVEAGVEVCSLERIRPVDDLIGTFGREEVAIDR